MKNCLGVPKVARLDFFFAIQNLFEWGVYHMADMAGTYFIIYNRLDEDEKYKGLSVYARYLYGKLRDTLKLSIMNNWQDENGFYVRMTRIKMSILLGCCVPTIRKIIKELINVGLLNEKREGFGKSNRIYVHLLPGEEELAFQCKVKQRLPSTKKRDFTYEGNAVSPNQRNSIQRESSTEEITKAPSYTRKAPPTQEDIKKEHFWVLKEGSIFRYQSKFWIYEHGEVTPYCFGEDLKRGAIDLLAKIGMPLDDIPKAMASVGM